MLLILKLFDNFVFVYFQYFLFFLFFLFIIKEAVNSHFSFWTSIAKTAKVIKDYFILRIPVNTLRIPVSTLSIQISTLGIMTSYISIIVSTLSIQLSKYTN